MENRYFVELESFKNLIKIIDSKYSKSDIEFILKLLNKKEGANFEEIVSEIHMVAYGRKIDKIKYESSHIIKMKVPDFPKFKMDNLKKDLDFGKVVGKYDSDFNKIDEHFYFILVNGEKQTYVDIILPVFTKINLYYEMEKFVLTYNIIQYNLKITKIKTE